MNQEQILLYYKEKYAEYLEMYEDPNELLLGLLLKKIEEQQRTIEYLERSIRHVYK